jgi:hypothetical protein
MGLNELALPAALDSSATGGWASNTIAEFRASFVTETDPTRVESLLEAFSARFNDAFLENTATVVLWFSGKDILSAIADWLVQKGLPNPGEFRAQLRDWVIRRPDRALELLPEWLALQALLTT